MSMRSHDVVVGGGELVGGLVYNTHPGEAGLMAGSVFGHIAGRSAAVSRR